MRFSDGRVDVTSVGVLDESLAAASGLSGAVAEFRSRYLLGEPETRLLRFPPGFADTALAESLGTSEESLALAFPLVDAAVAAGADAAEILEDVEATAPPAAEAAEDGDADAAEEVGASVPARALFPGFRAQMEERLQAVEADAEEAPGDEAGG